MKSPALSSLFEKSLERSVSLLFQTNLIKCTLLLMLYNTFIRNLNEPINLMYNRLFQTPCPGSPSLEDMVYGVELFQRFISGKQDEKLSFQ